MSGIISVNIPQMQEVVSMENNVIKRKTKLLEKTIDQLCDEYRFNFLCVLEALIFAQNEREMPVEETGNK